MFHEYKNTQKLIKAYSEFAGSVNPKPFKKSHREASSFHSLSTASAISSYPKPFKRMLRILLAFLMLIGLRKRAFDTASH
jgi:hypothetical protein